MGSIPGSTPSLGLDVAENATESIPSGGRPVGLHAATELSTGWMAHSDGTVAAISTTARAQPHLTPAAVACPPTFGNEGPMSGSYLGGSEVLDYRKEARPGPPVELAARSGTYPGLAGDGTRSSVVPDPAASGREADCASLAERERQGVQARTVSPSVPAAPPSTDELKQINQGSAEERQTGSSRRSASTTRRLCMPAVATSPSSCRGMGGARS